MSVPVTLKFQSMYIKAVEKEGASSPEMRLPPSQWGGVMTVLSFLWLGWSGYRASTHW